MSNKKTEPELSPAEKEADLKRRQKDYVFMTGAQVEQGHAEMGLRPLKDGHWMTKAKEDARLEKNKTDRQERMLFLANGWKRLAKNKRNELAELLGGIVCE